MLCGAALLATLATAAATGKASPAGNGDLTLSFDADPYLAEFGAVQTGYRCGSDGKVNFTIAGQSQPAAQAFARDGSTRRDGRYSAHVFLRPGDYSSYSCQKEAVLLLKGLGEGEGSEAWYGWSWRFPDHWTGSNSWGTLLEFATDASLFPSYGQLVFDASISDQLRLYLKTGRIPSPGAADFNPIAPDGYKATVTLLGPPSTAPRPLTRGVWHDFYMHIVWRSRTKGVLTIWHRQEDAALWEKLYDNTGALDALIKAPAHPTLMYNDSNGAPGENGRPSLALQAGFYRANQDVVADYWFDGFRRRQSEEAILAGFPGASPAPLPATTTTQSDPPTAPTVATPATAPDRKAPSVPRKVVGKPLGSPVRILLSWAASTDNVGVVGYRIYCNGSVRASVRGTSYTDFSTEPRKTYSYKVMALDAAGNKSAPTRPIKVRALKN